VDDGWTGLYRTGAAAAVAILALIPIQIAVWLAWPPPTTVEGFFALFRRNPLLGLLGLDLLYLVTVTLMVPLLLALGVALRGVRPSTVLLALALGLVAIATYFPSNPAFEMLALSNQHAAAATEAQRAIYLAAGEAMLATYTGTAFAVYYVLNGVALLLLATAMRHSPAFGKATAYAGILSGLLFLVPSSAGTIGAIFSLACLVPWTVFSVLAARRLFQLGQTVPNGQMAEVQR
jgi:hypothetical protein